MGEGRRDVHNEARSGHPSVITDDLKERDDAHVPENRRLTIHELHKVFPHVSRTVIFETGTVELQYGKICARRVPRTLINEHKKSRTG
jgi:hypothetical protein